MRTQSLFDGKELSLDSSASLRAGDSTSIYSLKHHNGLAAKVYRQPTPVLGRKLSAMIERRPEETLDDRGRFLIAWPLDLLLDTINGKEVTVGFIMPLVRDSRPINAYYTPDERRRIEPLVTYESLLRIAFHLTSAVSRMHEQGFVIGRLDEARILVSSSLAVALIGTDCFQIQESGGQFHHSRAHGQVSYDVLASLSIPGRPKSEADDLVALSAILRKLLLNGAQPLTEASAEIDSNAPVESSRETFDPLESACFNSLHPGLQELFNQSQAKDLNGASTRLNSSMWLAAIEEATETLRVCSANNNHYYGSHLDECPWCEYSARSNTNDPFPAKAERPPTGKLSVEGVTGPLAMPSSDTEFNARATGQFRRPPELSQSTPKPELATGKRDEVTGKSRQSQESLESNARSRSRRVAAAALWILCGIILLWHIWPGPQGTSAADAPSPDSKAATASALGVEATTIRFYDSSSNKGQRTYSERFDNARTSFVGWEVGLNYPTRLVESSVAIEAVWYREDDTILTRQKLNLALKPGQIESFHAMDWGYTDGSQWEAGKYRVDLLVGGSLAASGTFTVY